MEAWLHQRNWPYKDRVTERIQFGADGWERRYYTEMFDLETLDGECPAEDSLQMHRRETSACYLEGIFWIRDYYLGHLKDAQWCYGFHASPLLTDLVQALRTLAGWRPVFEKRPFLRPLEQLALVLPTRSFSLLPKPIAALLQDPAQSLWPYYPMNVHSRGAFRQQAWEFTLLLPPWPRDLRPLLEQIECVVETLPTKVRARNAVHREVSFK
jgi:5'-3' exonuclease